MCKKNRHIILLIFFALSAVFAEDFKEDLSKNVVVEKLGRKHGVEVSIQKIPHVNQRQNYCVPATCSMVLRYFDQRYNQKDLGKLFSSSSRNGTFVAAVYKAFQQPEFKDFKIVPIYQLTVRDWNEMKSAYEAALNDPAVVGKKAKKIKKKKRRSKDDEPGAGNGWSDFEPSVAVKVFSASRTRLKTQMNTLCREFIDAGIPVLWTVSMTLDPNSPSPDGHMRIINGYIVKDGQITRLQYRDSWSGHRSGSGMPIGNAVAMTTGLFVIIPRGLDLENLKRIEPMQKTASNSAPAAKL